MSRYLFITCIAAFLIAACSGNPPLRPTNINVPEGFQIEVAVQDLATPTMARFDDQGRMLIAESEYGGEGEPDVTRIVFQDNSINGEMEK